MSSTSAVQANKSDEVHGFLTLGVIIVAVIMLGMVSAFIGVLEWSNGDSFWGPTREMGQVFWNGAREVFQPYQCRDINIRSGKWYPSGPASPQDVVWWVKVVIVGGWYIYGAAIVAMFVGAILCVPFRPKIWPKADTVIGVCLIIWLSLGLIVAMIAMILTSRQHSQCF